MRLFHLFRREDVTGISGVGIIAEGVQFTDGTCVMRWKTNTTSTAVYNSITDLEVIHGHNGATVVLWKD